MDLENIRALLVAELAEAEIELEAEGSNLRLALVSDAFDGMSKLKRQQLVYKVLNDQISSGEIHAVTMTTQTKSENQV